MSEINRPWTPGPWRVGRTFSTHNAPTRFWETSVDAVSGVGPVATSSGALQSEAESNAALIAAAPDLYEALLMALMEVSRHETDYHHVTGQTSLDKIMVALSKARGEIK